MSVSDSSVENKPNYELIDPDVRLMLEVRNGSASAYEKLVKKYEQRIFGFFEHMVARDQAEDLAQEVFLRVFRARENYTPGAKFSTWLFTITHNVASNALRRRSRNMEFNLSPDSNRPGNTGALERLAISASGHQPTRQLDNSERAEIVRAAIQSLKERQRTAVLLSKYEGMSYQEIADTMELTPQAVKSLLSRARANLKDILQPYLDTGILPSSATPDDG
ncbi:MAG: sigma-70 family RNA polymerase sigma factor [Pirellulaceae bacterium]